MTRATAAIGDLPIRPGLEAAWASASSTDGPPHSAHISCRERTEKSAILWQAGTLLSVTETVGSLCHAACATSDRGVADGIRASLADVAPPVAVAPSCQGAHRATSVAEA